MEHVKRQGLCYLSPSCKVEPQDGGGPQYDLQDCRKGDKTIIELFNVDWNHIHLLPEEFFTSIAWDFKANRPMEDEVDCRVYLR